jgi:hypothetical protein
MQRFEFRSPSRYPDAGVKFPQRLAVGRAIGKLCGASVVASTHARDFVSRE